MNERRPAWSTKTFWVHTGANILTLGTVKSGKPFHRSQVGKSAINRTKRQGLLVNNLSVATGFAFHYLERCGFLKRIQRGIYQITDAGRRISRKDAEWRLYQKHRKYNEGQSTKTVKIKDISVVDATTKLIAALEAFKKMCCGCLKAMSGAIIAPDMLEQ